MKKTRVHTNWLNKVIVSMMMMTVTTATTAMAGNTKHANHDKKTTVVVVNNDKKVSHFDNVNRALSHNSYHKRHAYRPDVKTCTFRVCHRDSHRKVVAKVENMKGVMVTKWNPRTREVTVIYDAKVTSARHIKHFMA